MVKEAPEAVRMRIDAAMANCDLDAYLEAKKEELKLHRQGETPEDGLPVLHLFMEMLAELKQINAKLEKLTEEDNAGAEQAVMEVTV